MDLCTCLSFSQTRTSCCRACVHLFQLPLTALCGMGFMCACFHLTACTLFRVGVIFHSFLQLCQKRLCAAWFACLPLSAPQSRPLHLLYLLATRVRLCAALARFVFPVTLSYLGPPLCAARVVWGWLGLYATPLLVPRACHLFGSTVHDLLTGLRNTPFSVYCLPSPSKSTSCLVFQNSVAPLFGPAYEGVSQHGELPGFRALLPGTEAPAQKFSLFSLFMSPLLFLPHFKEFSLSSWTPGVFCCCLEVAL